MKFLLSLWLCFLFASIGLSQVAEKKVWMSVGAIHNWYSNYGSEREEGLVAEQQYGLRWPALYQHQDMQAAKGLWIGTTNFTDSKGTFQHKVVHVGPRVTGSGEFFPVRFKMISKYEPPVVKVDEIQTSAVLIENDSIDKNMKWDRIIDNVVNTSIGLTMNRKIIGFSQQFNDNYIVYDYTFTNTGVIDEKGTLRAPTTLTGVYFLYQCRYAVNADTRLVIGNATGWGINTVTDVRGDTANPGPANYFSTNTDNNDLRINYAWHGRYSGFTQYDNIGGPVFIPYYDKTDTIGRLGASQFVGLGTLHVDSSPTDTTDYKIQPLTTSYTGSDDVYSRNNDQYNASAMTGEYTTIMAVGKTLPRHADKAGLTGDPSLNTSGGQSLTNGYGPFTIAPGQSIRIVMVEAANGLSREANIAIGKQFKSGVITAAQKNAKVFEGRDSLFRTVRRAVANFNAGWNIPQPPPPPKTFSVNSGAGRIKLEWTPNGDNPSAPAVAKWEVWRAVGRYDSTYYKIWEGSGSGYDDTTASLNTAHYYYVSAVGAPTAMTIDGVLRNYSLSSNRYYTQTYLPAFRRTPPASSLAEVKGKIRVVPNPYVIGAAGSLSFPDQPDKLSFVNIPGKCTIRIYSELGELIKTLENLQGTGSLDYDLSTSSNQIITSGIYIAVIDTPQGEREIIKFVVIR